MHTVCVLRILDKKGGSKLEWQWGHTMGDRSAALHRKIRKLQEAEATNLGRDILAPLKNCHCNGTSIVFFKEKSSSREYHYVVSFSEVK